MVVKRHVILDIYHFKCDLNRETGSSRTKKKPGVFLVPASCAADRKVQILGRHHWQYFVIYSFGAADTVGFSAIIKTIYSIFLRNDTLCFNRTYTIFCKTGDTGIR